MRDTERQGHRQREKQAPCREPDTGLDLRFPESRPGLKADVQPLSHPGVLNHILLGRVHPIYHHLATSYTGLFSPVLPTSTFSSNQQILTEDLLYAMYFVGIWEVVGNNIGKILYSSAVKK